MSAIPTILAISILALIQVPFMLNGSMFCAVAFGFCVGCASCVVMIEKYL